MDENSTREARAMVVAYVANARQALIRELLDAAGNDVRVALKLMTKRRPGHPDTPSVTLGNWSSCVGEWRARCYGAASTRPIQVWTAERAWQGPPDLIVTWREVFEYVRDLPAPLGALAGAARENQAPKDKG